MASSSSSCSSTPIKKYDVFLSFRGDDTRDGFTSHLHAALRRSKIVTYIDYELKKGDEISPSLLRAIEESKISVIVLSENYASSKWCLDELVHILSCREESGQLVVPVFYGVVPSDVRKQQGSYAAALAAMEQRFAPNIEKVRQWRRALATVADLSGWDASIIKPEAELVEKMVKDILEKLRHTICTKNEYKHLVGMYRRVEKIESMLHIGSSDVLVISIWGMAGIGKTTLARVVFDRLSSQFDNCCCFVENFSENLEKLGQQELKKQVFSAIFDDNTVLNVSKFGELNCYEDRLRRSKVLIVLDNLKHWKHLTQLVGDDIWFASGSRIIVTTQDKQVIKNDDNRMYKVDGLDHDEALHLFNFNAFSKKLPTANCIEMGKEVVNHCEGNPLALTVLGSYFGGKCEERWKDALEKLKCLPNNDIHKVLKMSYDELDEMQKDIFLDIACFFEGEDKDHVERILHFCGFFPKTGIDDLIDKSLLTVVNNELKMHNLLREMGQEVVRQQSIKFPGKRSRIWLAEDVCHVLQDNTGTQNIEGIFFNMSEINTVIHLSHIVFQRMHNLRLLKFYNLDPKMKCKMYLPEDLYLPNRLRYLHWDRYPLKALPKDFSAKYLVELNMPNSQVKELWSGGQDLTSLRKIDLNYSENLTEISSLCGARNLEHVYLEYCRSLSQVPSEFKHLEKLKTLILEGCSSLQVFPELPSSIECLVLNGTEIEQVPSSIGSLTELRILSLRDCEKLISLPTSICKLKRVLSLSLSGSKNLERLPEFTEPMSSRMVLEYTSIGAPPITIRNLTGVELQDHNLIPRNICRSQSWKCTSLLELENLNNQDLKLTYHFFYEKHCPEVEIVSISTTELIRNSSYNYVFKKSNNYSESLDFLFYNYIQLPGYIHQVHNYSMLQFFHTQIQSLSSIKKEEFLETEFGFCYIRNPEIPNWFSYQFEDSSSVRIRLDKHQQPDTLLGFSMCVVVGIEDYNYLISNHNKFKLVCQVHYQLSNGSILSWDFYWDKQHDQRVLETLSEPNFRHKYMESTRPEAVFDFYFVDENKKPIKACTMKRCGIHLEFEEDFREQFAFFDQRCHSEERWKDAVAKLKRLRHNDIQKVLKVSYDELDEMQKNIFLDFACFLLVVDNKDDNIEKIHPYLRFLPTNWDC